MGSYQESKEERHLTQEQLGNLIGVKNLKSHGWKGGKSSFSTMARVFKAMNISAYFSMPGIERLPCGKVKTWMASTFVCIIYLCTDLYWQEHRH